MLSSYSISEEVTKAIYIESKHKVLIGSLNNWSWNDQESSTLNGKHDDTKGLVLIKKFEKGNLKFNNAPKQMDDNSELIEEDLAVQEEELELEDNFNQNANKKVLKTLDFWWYCGH